jgi:hypothetical protein
MTHFHKLARLCLEEGNEEVLEFLLENEDFEKFWRIVYKKGKIENNSENLNIPGQIQIDSKDIKDIKDGKELFKKFCKMLEKSGLTSKGLKTNPCPYIVIDFKESTQEAFFRLLRRRDVDLEVLVEVVKDYYSENEYRAKLSNYLDQCDLDLVNYKPDKFKNEFWDGE